MSSHKISVTVKFEAMHRIPNHSGKCKYIHGHSYTAIVTLSAANLDDMGMVIDFGRIKTPLRAWINEKWDHNSILNEYDPLIKFGKRMVKDKVWNNPFEQFGDKEPYTMTCNPTAENMAKELATVIQDIIDGIVPDDEPESIPQIESVIIKETDDCWATFVPEVGGSGGEGEGDSDSEGDDDDGGDDGEDSDDSEDDDSDEEEETPEATKPQTIGKNDPKLKGRKPREI